MPNALESELSKVEHFRRAYRDHFGEHRRERQFITTGGFFVTFGLTRAITHAIKAGKGPFATIGVKSGPHIHHMTFGIARLLIVGYLWVLQLGTEEHPSPRLSRISA